MAEDMTSLEQRGFTPEVKLLKERIRQPEGFPHRVYFGPVLFAANPNSEFVRMKRKSFQCEDYGWGYVERKPKKGIIKVVLALADGVTEHRGIIGQGRQAAYVAVVNFIKAAEQKMSGEEAVAAASRSVYREAQRGATAFVGMVAKKARRGWEIEGGSAGNTQLVAVSPRNEVLGVNLTMLDESCFGGSLSSPGSFTPLIIGNKLLPAGTVLIAHTDGYKLVYKENKNYYSWLAGKIRQQENPEEILKVLKGKEVQRLRVCDQQGYPSDDAGIMAVWLP